MSKYGSFSNGGNGNGNGGGNDRGYATNLDTGTFIKLQGDLSRIVQGSNSFGESIAVVYENGSLVDGILTERADKPGRFKVFGWTDAPVLTDDEDLSVDDLPPVMTAGRANNKYEILAARLEGDEDVGYDDDAMVVRDEEGEDVEFEGTGPIPLDLIFRDDNGEPDARFSVWEGSSDSGPAASAKTTTSVLTTEGKSAILDEDAKFNWIQEGVTLRPELEGLTVTYAKIEKESDREDDNGNTYTFHHPVWLTEDGNAVMPDNSGEQEAERQPETPQPVADGGEEAAEGDSPLDEFVSTCVGLNLDTDPAIRGLFEDMAEDDQYPDLTDESVDDMDELVEQVQDAVAEKAQAA